MGNHRLKLITGQLLLAFSAVLLFVQCERDDKLFIYTPPETEIVTESLPWLSVSGNQIVDEDSSQVLLHGVNRSALEYSKSGMSSGIPMTEEDFRMIIQDWHANIIRLPFRQSWVLEDPDYVETIASVVNWCKKYGAYVLLDLQWQDGINPSPDQPIMPMPNEEAAGMWQILAERFQDEPNVLYDIHNEVHEVSFTDWRSRAIEIIDAIREVHAQSLIFVGGIDWSTNISYWFINPLPVEEYPNIVYKAHHYPVGSPNDDPAVWEGVWEGRFGAYADDLPVFIGELGTSEETFNDQTWLVYVQTLIHYLDSRQIGWCAWSMTDKPRLTESDDHTTPTAYGTVIKANLDRYIGIEEELILENVTAHSLSYDRITIDWDTNFESDSKVLYGFEEGVYTDSTEASALLYHHTVKLRNLLPETTYYFACVSEGLWGQRMQSTGGPFTTTEAPLPVPATPEGFAAAVSGTDVTLTWNLTDFAEGYRIYRTTDAYGEFELTAEIPDGSLTYLDAGLSSMTIYYYKISAFNESGESELSSAIFAMTMF